MARLGLWNIAVGFSVVTVSASAGIFVAFDLTEIFLKEIGDINDWYQILSRSAHGHFNLFGMLHILFGLTLSYSSFSQRAKLWQSIGLGLGTIAMGPAMFWRALLGPTSSFDLTGWWLGLELRQQLLALLGHCIGLSLKLGSRS